MKIDKLIRILGLILFFGGVINKIRKNKHNKKQNPNIEENQYKIPRKNIVINTITPSNPTNQQPTDSLNKILSTSNLGIAANQMKPMNLEKIRKYTQELLSNLEAKGKRMEKNRRRRVRSRKKRKLIQHFKHSGKGSRKMLFGPSSEDLHKKEMLDQEHSMKFIARQIMWDDELSAHRSAQELKLIIGRVDTFTDQYVLKMDQLVMNINGELEDEDHGDEEMEHEAEEHEMSNKEHALNDEVEHEHEEMLDEKEKMLDEEAEKLAMEERMEQDIKNLHENGAIEDLEEPVTKDQLNLVQQQMITLQQQLAGLQSSVEDNEENKVDLQEKIKSLMPPDLVAGNSNKLVGDLKEFKKKEEQYQHNKNELEMQITRVQQQVNTMQHQLNLMHQKQNKLDLETDVEDMVEKGRK